MYLFVSNVISENQKDNSQSNFEWEVGEELTYEVSYSFIKIGEIKIKVVERKKNKDKEFFRTSAQIYSYPSVPFINVNEIIESNYNIHNYSEYFRSYHLGYNPPRFTEYEINYGIGEIHVLKGILNPYKIKVDSTSKIISKVQDGLSLLYYARNYSGTSKHDTIACFLVEKKDNTLINFTSKREGISISSVDYDIDTRYLEGYSKIVGLYGLTGEFEGWFSNDLQAVPIKAKLNVFIGQITVELKNWRKKNWIPPKYN